MLIYKSVCTGFTLFQRVITVKNQRWDGCKDLKHILAHSVLVLQPGKKISFTSGVSNGSLNIVTNNFMIASSDFFKTLNIPQIHNALTTCIKPQRSRTSHNLVVQAILVAVDFCRSLCIIVGGSLISKSRKKGLI